MILKIYQKIRRQYDYYRKLGFAKFCRHVFVDFICHINFFIFERDFALQTVEEKAKIPIKIHLLSNSEIDIDRLVNFWPDVNTSPLSTPESIKELIKNRFVCGEECLVAEYEGKIVFMNWVGFKNSHKFEPYEIKRGIDRDEIISYNIYCDPGYRGNNLMGAVNVERYKLYKGRGYKKSISYVECNNIASLKVITRFCGKPVMRVSWFCLFGFSFCFLSRNA